MLWFGRAMLAIALGAAPLGADWAKHKRMSVPGSEPFQAISRATHQMKMAGFGSIGVAGETKPIT